MNFHILSVIRLDMDVDEIMSFHNDEHSQLWNLIFCREDPELVEALDIEEVGGEGEEDYWANTVILQQTLFFYPFFRLNVIIDILSSRRGKLWSIYPVQ